ncbi:Biogenesis of lysosome-related organelles complex 1 subunit 2 [Camellia lanceoleosa]|uniref:Biogenesis of lysosome-related organelles complex 1 subunit 2 n=1 Tax=Camellia lanceoleosa TaxID=1840588 RepID=A0ACC0IWJ0_9ERIC|nr:Biogenesis of lysosome-related organelles complex 1 subunit 2 [Camellia lanceoleosa]
MKGSSNVLELLEKMNLRVAEEYKGYGDVASGLRVFVEQLKSKSGSFDEYVQQIDAIEQQVTEFEAHMHADSILFYLKCMLPRL